MVYIVGIPVRKGIVKSDEGLITTKQQVKKLNDILSKAYNHSQNPPKKPKLSTNSIPQCAYRFIGTGQCLHENKDREIRLQSGKCFKTNKILKKDGTHLTPEGYFKLHCRLKKIICKDSEENKKRISEEARVEDGKRRVRTRQRSRKKVQFSKEL